jgi:hypothetical protein
MPTVQIWINDEDMESLRRLKEYFEYEQDRDFEGKSWRVHNIGMRRKRIRRKTINVSYIYRQALNLFWCENEKYILDFEKNNRHL